MNSYQGRPDFKGPWHAEPIIPRYTTTLILDAQNQYVGTVLNEVSPLVELAPSLYLAIVEAMTKIETCFTDASDTLPVAVQEAHSILYGAMKAVEKGMVERGN